jgi:hypothetical protein
MEATEPSAETVMKDIRRVTRKRYSAEEKIPIVLDGDQTILLQRERIKRKAIEQRRLLYRKGAA